MRIPDTLHEIIMTKLAAGWTQARVSKWLQRHHALTVSRASIGRFAQRVQKERGTVARAVARDRVAAAVGSDLDLLGREIARIDNLLVATGEHAQRHPTETRDYLALLDRLGPLLALRAKFAGADTPDDGVGVQGLAELVGLAL